MPLDYPHPTELEQRVGLHYKPFRLFRLTPSLAIQPLVRAIFFYLASNPRSRVSSQYGKMSEESLAEFLAENDLSFLELSDDLELPAIDERYFADPNEFAATGEDDQGRLDEKNPVTCPECGHEFVP